MTDKECVRSLTERLIKCLEESRVKKLQTPLEIVVTELELTDLSEKILDEINPELVNIKLVHHMVSAEHVD